MLTVMTWLWSQPGGRATYTPHHVHIWADMVRRNLSMPHRLAVVTDIDADYGDIEIIPPPREFENVRIPTWGDAFPQCLRRIAMFAPDAGARFGNRFVSMDMDCVISGPLDPLFDRSEDFVMYRGTNAARPYNGSMVMMTAGARPQVYTEFSPEGAVEAGKRYIGSDQAWISHCLGRGEATWGPEHGVIWYGGQRNAAVVEKRIMFFPGTPKPWTLAQEGRDPFVSEHYRRSPAGRALMLGYAPHVWSEAESALRDGPYDAIIASPEAAAYLPDDVFAVAQTDGEADRIAIMHGFDDRTWCGRSEVFA